MGLEFGVLRFVAISCSVPIGVGRCVGGVVAGVFAAAAAAAAAAAVVVLYGGDGDAARRSGFFYRGTNWDLGTLSSAVMASVVSIYSGSCSTFYETSAITEGSIHAHIHAHGSICVHATAHRDPQSYTANPKS